MEPQTVVRRLKEVQVLDVRYPNEWEAGHIDGAVHIPVDDLAERVDELDPDRPVVAVCRSGQRSERAAQWLAGEGFDAENLHGGMEAWAEAGLDYRGSDGAVVGRPRRAPRKS